MTKKDIVTLVISLIVISACVFGVITILSPKKNTNVQGTKTEVVPVPKEIDEKTYKNVNDLKDYGKPNIEGIGKEDLFSGI